MLSLLHARCGVRRSGLPSFERRAAAADVQWTTFQSLDRLAAVDHRTPPIRSRRRDMPRLRFPLGLEHALVQTGGSARVSITIAVT